MKRLIEIPAEFLDLLISKKLAAAEIQVALALAKLIWGQGLREVQVTFAVLADMTNTGRAAVSHAVSRLEEYGVLVVKRRVGVRGGNVYRIVYEPEAYRGPVKTPELRTRVFRRDGYTCQYCGRRVPDAPTLDHVIDKRRRGSDREYNLLTACGRCNLEKAMLGAAEFFRRHPEARERLGVLVDMATLSEQRLSAEASAKAEATSRSGTRPAGVIGTPRLDVPDMVVKDWPSTEVIAGPFLCPIFEKRCPLAAERHKEGALC